jgi:hypothetical protein
MKTRKLFLILGLVVILLLGTVLVANAANKIIVTGAVNNSYFGMGWEWSYGPTFIDPVTQEAVGKSTYRVYLYDESNKKYWMSWVGESVCGALGEFDGKPTVAVVTQIVSQKNIDPSWVGKYLKTTISDGGENASQDIIGVVVWDLEENGPVDYMPSCDFEKPMEDFWYYSQNGNFTIHD